jgi:hypothetical protein
VLPCTPSTGAVERFVPVSGQVVPEVEKGKRYRRSDVSFAMLTMLRETWDIV